MANSLSGSIGLAAGFNLASAQGLSVAASAPFAEIINLVYANGTGAKQADMVLSLSASLATTSATVYTFSGSVLKDAFGGNFNPAKMKALLLYAWTSNANNVILGNNANHVPIFSGALNSIPVQPGGIFVWAIPGTGVTVTGGTGDIVQVASANPASPASFDMIALCTSV